MTSISTDRLREIVEGTAAWTCNTSEGHGPLWYVRLDEAAKPPYRVQKHVEAIIDIADDGTLAGIELIDNMPPAPLALRSSPNREEKLIEALRDVRRAIVDADPAILTDTLWLVGPASETAVDRIDAALALQGTKP